MLLLFILFSIWKIVFSSCTLRKKCSYLKLLWFHFPAFGLNMERYLSVFSPNAKKMQTRMTQKTDTFCAVVCLLQNCHTEEGSIPHKLKYRKDTTLSTKSLKRQSKRIKMKMTQIFHFTQPSQSVFTCSKSIMKTKRQCPKYEQI